MKVPHLISSFVSENQLFVSELEEGHANQSIHANQSNQSNHEA